MDLQSAKNLGGIGALLLVIAGIGLLGTSYMGLLGIIGIILVLVALNGMAENYKEPGIFRNGVYFIVAAIVGIAVFIGALIASLIYFLSNLPDWMQTYVQNRDWQGLANALPNHTSDLGSLWTVIASAIIAFVVLFVMLIVAMIFLRRSLGLLSSKSKVGLFGTAGLLMLIGAALTIIIIGFVLIWVGWILLTIAFFSIREIQPAKTYEQSQSTPLTPPVPP